MRKRWFWVNVTRVSSYPVRATSADKAVDTYMNEQPEECGQETTDMRAEPTTATEVAGARRACGLSRRRR
jgi:hypothetical protein